MTHWRELGEVPDSEDEDGFESQDFETVPVPAARVAAAAVQPKSIWDFPDSEDEQSRPPADKSLCPGPRPASSLSDSSPLSSAPSEDDDLPPVQQLISSHKPIGLLVSSELGGTSQLTPRRHPDSQNGSKDSDKPGPLPPPQGGHAKEKSQTPEEADHGAGDHEVRQSAIRYERSLRPRKPIQEHPYLLENVYYNRVLRKHGVKPLKLATQMERPRREDTALDGDFEDDSQESAQRGGLDESQPSGFGTSLGDLDELDLHSSSPPKTPALNGFGKSSSQMGSQGDTDATSIHGQHLPALEELLNRPRSLFAKRQATPPFSTARKRRRINIIDSDPDEPAVTPMREPGSQAPPISPLFQPYRRASLGQATNTQQPQHSPSTVMQNSSCLSESPPPADSVVEISSDDEGEEQRASVHCEVQDSSISGSDTESDTDIVYAVGRRLRGILPASWLRLDLQSGRDKAQMDAKRRRRYISPEREGRRGVAQSRQALPGSTTAHLVFDESDDDEAATSSDTTKIQHQNRGQTGITLDPAPSRDEPDLGAADDAESVVEENHFDFMLPGRFRQKRQLKLSDGLYRDPKRQRAAQKSASAPQRKRSKQPKITSLFQQPQGSDVVPDARPSGPSREERKSRKKRSSGRSGRTTSSQILSPPRLSILDIIEPDAPRFLRIAARTAKKRSNQGRSSPWRKAIQLATRQDHLDALSVLRRWRAGSIPQRPSVMAARSLGQRQRRQQPFAEGSGNRPNPSQKPTAATTRKFVKHVGNGGSISYRPRGASGKSQAEGRGVLDKGTARTHLGSPRPALLEMDEHDQEMSVTFQARKRLLDRLYRKHHFVVPPAAPATDTSEVMGLPFDNGTSDGEHPEPFTNAAKAQARQPRRIRFRKRAVPRHVDTGAPQYSHANDPLPVHYAPESGPIEVNHQKGRVFGLGPYGTNYTHHFEVFPLDPDVYFHESTLMGSGVVESCANSNMHDKSMNSRPDISFNLGGQSLRWGPWDSQVSSELGIVLDFLAEQIEGGGVEADPSDSPTAVDAATFVLGYLKDSISLPEEGKARSFAARTHECFSSFNERIGLQVQRVIQSPGTRRDLALRIYDRILLSVLVVFRLCCFQTTLAAERFQMEELLKKVAMTSLSILSGLGASPVRKTYEDLSALRFRERGLRDDAPTIHSWVVLMNVLEVAHIPRASFWELAHVAVAPPQVMSSVDARDYERSWELMFTLLPLVEFNNAGVVIPGRRHDTASDGWAIPQKLLRRVFQLYLENTRQSASFNDYCRALVGRCHYLVQQWGWRRCGIVVGIIFDFFGSQDLAHLRNEEVYESPRFLEELGRRPTLDVEPRDKCFHVFLKLVALSIQKLREAGTTNDIRNLVARTIPNHNRQHLKEQTVHSRDLAALRNHHDLLGTLFWASPPELRPAISLIERLVVPASSHKEACLINIRCWNQLARFVVASGESVKSFRPFLQWRNAFFQQVLRQFDSVASDTQQQALALAKDVGQSISEDMINATISANKAAVRDVLHASAAASWDVMKHTPNLEAATFVLNTPQLQNVFKQFAGPSPELDWGILRVSLATLDSFLARVDEFKENEESQENASEVLNSAPADDALLLVDQEISRSFFSMARRVVSLRRDEAGSAASRLDEFSCREQAVTLSARMGMSFISGGIIRLSDMFKVGKYGLFDGPPCKLHLGQRRDLVLFVSTLLEHGFDDFSDAGFSLSELWALSIVKPREYLRYETQLAEQLGRSGKTFVPDAVMGLAIQLDYNTNRDLFEFAISAMRRSIRDAGLSLQKSLLLEHSRTLKLVMEQMKCDLSSMSRDGPSHDRYVAFVQDIISLIRAHGSEIRAVDNFFYQISKEYSPSIQDPQLQVAGLISYGLRLREGDGRSGQQLFYFLFNNAKIAMMNNKPRVEVSMLRKGMENQGIVDFALGKMLPAIIRCSFKNSAAFPLMDMYSEALRLLLTGKTVAYELGEDDLPQVGVLMRAALEGMGGMSRSSTPLSGAQLHLVRQTMGVVNLLWPSIRIISASGLSSSAWTMVTGSLGQTGQFASAAEVYLEELSEAGGGAVEPARLFAGLAGMRTWELAFDADVSSFTESMRVGIETAKAISMPSRGNARGAVPAQGMEIPPWDTDEIRKDLHERIREWRWWWKRVFGACSGTELLENVIF